MSTYTSEILPADLAEFLTNGPLQGVAQLALIDGNRVQLTEGHIASLAAISDEEDGHVDQDEASGLHRMWVSGTEYYLFPEQVTSEQAARLLSAPGKPVTGGDNAGRILRGLGLSPVSRQPGRTGQNLWDRDQIIDADAKRPGQGSRTDRAQVLG